VQSAVEFKTATCVWSLDGPGSFEADVFEPSSTDWLFGRRRLVVKDGATAKWGGYLTRLTRGGEPGNVEWKVAGLGLASVLERMIVHGDFSKTSVVATTIMFDLIQHAEAQANGDQGFTLGTITGTAPARTRHYCDGDVIAERIAELAALYPGIDWELTPAGVFNAWVGGRGVASGLTLSDTAAQDFEVEAEVSDLATYVSAIGEADQPCGAPLETRTSTWALPATWGRREIAIDVDSSNAGEMQARADTELQARSRARTRVSIAYEQTQCPFAFGALWLGDTATVSLPTIFGGSQTMRCIEVRANLERPSMLWAEYVMEGA
jgi:hypothetical protein